MISKCYLDRIPCLMRIKIMERYLLKIISIKIVDFVPRPVF